MRGDLDGSGATLERTYGDGWWRLGAFQRSRDCVRGRGWHLDGREIEDRFVLGYVLGPVVRLRPAANYGT